MSNVIRIACVSLGARRHQKRSDEPNEHRGPLERPGKLGSKERR
jgi:hypothetical protein